MQFGSSGESNGVGKINRNQEMTAKEDVWRGGVGGKQKDVSLTDLNQGHR